MTTAVAGPDAGVKQNRRVRVGRVSLLGLLTVGLYVLLFSLEREILALTARGGWSFLIPVGIAFLFSVVHGKFTSEFWEVLGVQAKK